MNYKIIVERFARRLYYRILVLLYALPRFFIKKAIKHSCRANVVFVISSIAMWRLQDVYDILCKDDRYCVSIVIAPFDTYSKQEQIKSIDELHNYFDSLGIRYVDAINGNLDPHVWKGMNPQIVFYQQMYSTIYHGTLALMNNLDKLICYFPYGIITVKGVWVYNSKYINLAWKVFYQTELHRSFAKSHSFNKGRNVEVVGEPRFEQINSYLEAMRLNNRLCTPEKKTIIWAPHFSINQGYLSRASFLYIAATMLEVADSYPQINFVLKPHPRLISELYKHPDWGKDKTDAYFSSWDEGKNTAIITGDYISLFCESCAMIHDCGSFTAEYIYTTKPALFISNDFSSVYRELDSFGSMCMDLHYKGDSKHDIISFINEVVINNNDPLKSRRQEFHDSYLSSNKGDAVGERIMRILSDSLFDC